MLWTKKDNNNNQMLYQKYFVIQTLPTKCRKLSKGREATALHHSIIEDLLEESNPNPHSNKKSEPATRDIGIQCYQYGITTYIHCKVITVSLLGKICCHV